MQKVTFDWDHIFCGHIGERNLTKSIFLGNMSKTDIKRLAYHAFITGHLYPAKGRPNVVYIFKNFGRVVGKTSHQYDRNGQILPGSQRHFVTGVKLVYLRRECQIKTMFPYRVFTPRKRTYSRKILRWN